MTEQVVNLEVSGSDSRTTKPGKLTDLIPDDFEEMLQWNPTSAISSLDTYFKRFNREATRTIGWYYEHRRSVAMAARTIRWLAILATAIGGLYPIWSPLLPSGSSAYHDLGYPLLALAAALIAIDRFGGLSSAWMRCITTAQALSRELRAFRLDWSQLRASIAANTQPAVSYAQLVPLFERLRTFATKHDEIVETETRTWIAEFRSVLSELGRSPKKEEAPATVVASAPALTKSGVVELTIEGAENVDGDMIVDITGIKQPPTRNAKLRLTDLAPGFHRITVTGKVNGLDAFWEAIADVPAGGVASIVARRR
jgi:hypothetical protein